MNNRLEALRILVAAGVIPANGIVWDERTANQAGQFFLQMAQRIQAEMAPPPKEAPSEE